MEHMIFARFSKLDPGDETKLVLDLASDDNAAQIEKGNLNICKSLGWFDTGSITLINPELWNDTLSKTDSQIYGGCAATVPGYIFKGEEWSQAFSEEEPKNLPVTGIIFLELDKKNILPIIKREMLDDGSLEKGETVRGYTLLVRFINKNLIPQIRQATGRSRDPDNTLEAYDDDGLPEYRIYGGLGRSDLIILLRGKCFAQIIAIKEELRNYDIGDIKVFHRSFSIPMVSYKYINRPLRMLDGKCKVQKDAAKKKEIKWNESICEKCWHINGVEKDPILEAHIACSCEPGNEKEIEKLLGDDFSYETRMGRFDIVARSRKPMSSSDIISHVLRFRCFWSTAMSSRLLSNTNIHLASLSTQILELPQDTEVPLVNLNKFLIEAKEYLTKSERKYVLEHVLQAVEDFLHLNGRRHASDKTFKCAKVDSKFSYSKLDKCIGELKNALGEEASQHTQERFEQVLKNFARNYNYPSFSTVVNDMYVPFSSLGDQLNDLKDNVSRRLDETSMNGDERPIDIAPLGQHTVMLDALEKGLVQRTVSRFGAQHQGEFVFKGYADGITSFIKAADFIISDVMELWSRVSKITPSNKDSINYTWLGFVNFTPRYSFRSLWNESVVMNEKALHDLLCWGALSHEISHLIMMKREGQDKIIESIKEQAFSLLIHPLNKKVSDKSMGLETTFNELYAHWCDLQVFHNGQYEQFISDVWHNSKINGCPTNDFIELFIHSFPAYAVVVRELTKELMLDHPDAYIGRIDECYNDYKRDVLGYLMRKPDPLHNSEWYESLLECLDNEWRKYKPLHTYHVIAVSVMHAKFWDYAHDDTSMEREFHKYLYGEDQAKQDEIRKVCEEQANSIMDGNIITDTINYPYPLLRELLSKVRRSLVNGKKIDSQYPKLLTFIISLHSQEEANRIPSNRF